MGFVIALARKSSNASALANRLVQEVSTEKVFLLVCCLSEEEPSSSYTNFTTCDKLQGGLPDSAATQGFAQSLLDKLPRSSGMNGMNAYTQQERKKAAIAARNQKYSLLEASDEEEGLPEPAAVPTTRAVPAKAKQLRKAKVSLRGKVDVPKNSPARRLS